MTLSLHPVVSVARLTVRGNSLFFQPGRGMPSHAALEWMAQACAAVGGSEALDEGGVVRMGFLLGARDFRADRAWFAERKQLNVRVRLEYRDEEMANFDCAITDSSGTQLLAKGSLNVYQPHDAYKLIGSPANS